MTNYLRLTVWLLAICSTLIVVYMLYWGSTIPNNPPVLNAYAVPMNSPVHTKNKLVVRVYRDKVREDCVPVSATRYAISLDTGESFELPSYVWDGGPIDESYVDLTIDTRGLPSGPYRGNAISTYPCPEGLYVVGVEFFFTVKDEY